MGLVSDENADDAVNKPVNKSSIRYPISTANEIGNWMIFSRKKYMKEDMMADGKYVDADGARQIELPIPANLSKGYNTEWDVDSMGAWGDFYRTNGASYIDKVRSNMGSGKGIVNSLTDAAGSYDLDEVLGIGKNALQAWGTDFTTASDMFKKVGGFAGLAKNPYKAVLFNSPNFRGFGFQWKLMPRNYQEAVAIKDMIREFQIGMSPGFDSIILNDIYTYPDMFLINFTKDEFLFKMKPCICDDIQVEYHADGMPSYIKGPNGEKIPSSMMVQVRFREISILTRKDFEEGGF